MSSASDFFGLVAINLRQAALKMLRFLLRRELAGQFPDFGGQTAALSMLRVIEFLSFVG